nr:aspartyl protease family protein At5g10770-like [Ipomoea batatas]
MASRNGPCSPSHNPPAKKIFSIEQSENANINSNSGYMEYFVTIGVGTPKAEFNMLVDTGSDNTWVLCKPCTTATGCAPNAHLFDPSKSSTYVKGSPDFHSFYGDKSYVSGVWGYDTLTVDKSHVVKKFQLGCGQNIHNTNFGNAAAGILGLGQGKGSLPSQGGSKFKTFSYCLPKSDSQVGYLVFGEEAHKKSSSSKPKFTPLLPPPNKLPKNYQGFGKSYYFVELIGISVAGKQLNVDPSVFASPGTIIDSGTSITQLPSKAYSALATAFNQSMASKYPAAVLHNLSKSQSWTHAITWMGLIVAKSQSPTGRELVSAPPTVLIDSLPELAQPKKKATKASKVPLSKKSKGKVAEPSQQKPVETLHEVVAETSLAEGEQDRVVDIREAVGTKPTIQDKEVVPRTVEDLITVQEA